MSDFSAKLKRFLGASAKVVGKGAKTSATAIGKAAKDTAKAANFKLEMLRKQHQVDDLVAELGKTVYGLAKSGVELPAEVIAIMEQVNAIEAEVEVLEEQHRAEKLAAAEEKAAAKAARAAEKAASKSAEAIDLATAPVVYDAVEPVEPPVERPYAPVSDVPVIHVAPEAAAEAPEFPTVQPAAPVIDLNEEVVAQESSNVPTLEL